VFIGALLRFDCGSVCEQSLHGARREPHRATHVTREMALVRKTGCQCDLRDGELVLHKQIFGSFDAALNDVLVKRNAGGFAKEGFEVRRADTGDRSDTGERQVFAEIVFDVGEGLLEPAPAQTSVLCGSALRDGAVGRDQARSDGDGKAVRIEPARWVVGFHLGLECPADVFQLSVSYLKAISDLYAARVEPLFFRDRIEQRGREGQDESRVVLVVDLPAGVRACGDDVDIAVHCGAGVAFSPAAARDLCSSADMDRDDYASQLRDFEYPDGIGTELQGEPAGRFTIGKDLRQASVGCDVQG